jgi:hypothetical protein
MQTPIEFEGRKEPNILLLDPTIPILKKVFINVKDVMHHCMIHPVNLTVVVVGQVTALLWTVL